MVADVGDGAEDDESRDCAEDASGEEPARRRRANRGREEFVDERADRGAKIEPNMTPST